MSATVQPRSSCRPATSASSCRGHRTNVPGESSPAQSLHRQRQEKRESSSRGDEEVERAGAGVGALFWAVSTSLSAVDADHVETHNEHVHHTPNGAATTCQRREPGCGAMRTNSINAATQQQQQRLSPIRDTNMSDTELRLAPQTQASGYRRRDIKTKTPRYDNGPRFRKLWPCT